MNALFQLSKTLESDSQVTSCEKCATKTEKSLKLSYDFPSPYLFVRFDHKLQNSISPQAIFDLDSLLINDNYYICNLLIIFNSTIRHYFCFKRSGGYWIEVDSLKNTIIKAKKDIDISFSEVSMMLLEKKQ